MDPVRLTHLVDSPTYGGAEGTIVQLLKGLPPRYACTLVASAPAPDPLAQAAGDRLVTFRGPSRRWPLLPAAARAVRYTRPHLVHVTCIDPRSNRALLAAALASGAPVVATVHMSGQVGGRAGAALLARLYRRLDAVFAVSDEIRALLVGALCVPAAAVQVLTNGVEPVEAAAPVRRRAGPVRIGGVGRLTPQKGWDVLITAVQRLLRDGRDVALAVAGDGRDRSRLEACAVGMPVEFVGFRHDVARFLREIDIFCLPSRAEGLPLALLEAMMAGLPAVATGVGGIPDAVGDAVSLVPPGDADALAGALRHLVDDPGQRARAGAAGAGVARARFDVRRTVADTASVYDAVMAATRRLGPRTAA